MHSSPGRMAGQPKVVMVTPSHPIHDHSEKDRLQYKGDQPDDEIPRHYARRKLPSDTARAAVMTEGQDLGSSSARQSPTGTKYSAKAP